MPRIDRSAEYLAKAESFDRLAKLAFCIPDAACACRHLADGYRALAAAVVGQEHAQQDQATKHEAEVQRPVGPRRVM
jgi:hypothetical protein